MCESLIASIDKVEGSNAVDIRDILPQPVQEGIGGLHVNWGNCSLILTEFKNVVVI